MTALLLLKTSTSASSSLLFDRECSALCVSPVESALNDGQGVEDVVVLERKARRRRCATSASSVGRIRCLDNITVLAFLSRVTWDGSKWVRAQR